MERKRVSSTNIYSIGYDVDSKVLEVEFQPSGKNRKGSIYQYKGVPEKVYRDWMSSLSMGTYFSKNIKNKYKGERV